MSGVSPNMPSASIATNAKKKLLGLMKRISQFWSFLWLLMFSCTSTAPSATIKSSTHHLAQNFRGNVVVLVTSPAMELSVHLPACDRFLTGNMMSKLSEEVMNTLLFLWVHFFMPDTETGHQVEAGNKTNLSAVGRCLFWSFIGKQF